MRNIFYSLLTFIFLLSATSNAQPGTVCNAQFTMSVSGMTASFVPVQINTSAQLQHYWSFGDNATSALSNPSHTYLQAGVYTIYHAVKYVGSNGITCQDSTFSTIVIQGNPLACNVTANYSFVRDSIQTNVVKFTNLSSTGANTLGTYRWIFGDGTTSTEINPTHTFINSGAYTVCLRATRDSLCFDDTCRIVQVQAPTTCNLLVNFISRADSASPNKIYFTNLSTPISSTDSISWNFGDGSFSADLNPTHTYNQAGTYRVCLFVRKASPAGAVACAREYCINVVVQDPCNFVAYFGVMQDPANVLKYNFTNYSTQLSPSDSIKWSFGDGTFAYTVNADHIYSQPGTYTVCLRVKKNFTAASTVPCVKEYCKTFSIVVANPCNVTANYSFVRDSIQTNVVKFTNLSSTGANTLGTYRWIFGDGTTSTEINPTHTFINSGAYTVCLRVTRDSLCFDDTCRIVQVQVPTTCNLVTYFSVVRDSANINKFAFTNLSSPLANTDSVAWNFGDGTGANTTNAQHVYAQPGTYNVCLLVKKYSSATAAPCVREYCKAVVVEALCSVLPSFTFTRDSVTGIANNVYRFSNTTINANATDSVFWNFGDNSALVVNSNNPVHAYANSGTYNVCLTIKRTYPGTTLAPCVRTACLTLVVPPVNNPCDYVPRFIFRTDAAVAGKLIFTNTTFTTASTNATAKWSFGDGTSSLSWNAEHTYNQSGVYVVCLTVNYGNTCSKSICDTISVVVNPISCAEARVSFSYRKDAYLPNKFYFFATTITPAISQQWSFKKIGDTSAAAITNQINPVWIFADTGRYKVCLRVVLTTGCVKEYCSVVYVQRNTAPSQCYLQAYPNPASSNVSVNVQLSQPQFINAYVYNSQNTLVANKIMQGFSGNNVVSMNISNLPPGFYIVRVIYGNSLCFSRFQKI